MLTPLQSRARSQGGFTLIELLVVVAILGILSAVVVFAVQGTSERGQRAAVQIDERILRTAEEAHCAQHGRYASGDELVAAGYLSATPEIHKVEATGDPADDGLCGTVPGANRYRITCLDGSPMPDCGLESAAIFDPRWFPASDLAEPAFFRLAVTLGDGRILHLGSALASSSPVVHRTSGQVYDPAADTWQLTAPPPGIAQAAVLLRGSPLECGANCGKVLVAFGVSTNSVWSLFDPVSLTWVGAGSSPYNRIYQAPGLVQLLPPNCGSHCGKVLVAGGYGLQAGDGSLSTSPPAGRSSELWDPKAPAFVPTSGQMLAEQRGTAAARLDDGRVLALGTAAGSQAEVYSPLTDQWSTLERQSVTPRANEETFALRLPSSDILFLNNFDVEIYSQRDQVWRGPYVCPDRKCYGADRGLALMRGGKVMITGGNGNLNRVKDVAQIFDPETGTFEDSPRQRTPRQWGRPSSLPGGRILLAGGRGLETAPLASVETFGGPPRGRP